MPTHSERRTLPYTAEQLYALVADIERYPEFLPWVLAARVRETGEDRRRAELMIGFKVFRERFVSEIRLTPHSEIEVIHGEGPFKHLRNHCRFQAREDGQADIDFFVAFEFRSKLLQKTVQALFSEAVRRMVAAFEGRAAALFGRE